jgi:NAD(P)H-hydrate epimerase
VPEDIYPIVAVKCDEVMPKPLPADGEGGLSAGALAQVRADLAGKSAALVGPGLGRGAGAAALTAAVLEGAACPWCWTPTV